MLALPLIPSILFMSRKTLIKTYTRRDILKGTASAIAVVLSRTCVWRHERITMAGIGVGGKGGSDISGAGEVGEVIALCDCDFNRGGGAAKKWPKAKKKFTDFREMLDKMGKDIDACAMSTRITLTRRPPSAR